jgi:glutathione S-transferase
MKDAEVIWWKVQPGGDRAVVFRRIKTPLQFITIDLQAGEQRQPAFLAINPIGKVPALINGDFKLWETGAILLYLAEKYDQVEALETRSLSNQWILYANATMGPEIFSEATREKALTRHMDALSHPLEAQPYILGKEFTVADVALGSLIGYIPLMLKVDLSPYPVITGYLQRLGERPAFQKTIGNRP